MMNVMTAILLTVMCGSAAHAQAFWNRTAPYSVGLNEVRFGGGDTVFGTMNSGFTRSANNGESWSPAVIVNYVQDIHVVPAGNIFLAQNQQRLSRSTNRGASWTVVGNGITETSCSSVLANSSGVVVVGTTGGIYRSTDNGSNFAKAAGAAQLGADTTIAAMATYDGSVWYAFTRSNGNPERGYALRSTDAGVTWTKGANSLDSVAIFKAVVHPNGTLYVRTGNGLRASTDGGNSWYLAAFASSYIADVTAAPNGTVFVGMSSSNGLPEWLHASTDNGATWAPLQTPSFGFSGIHVNAQGHLFLSQDQTYRSTDNGATWKPLPVAYPNVTAFTERANGEVYVAAGGSAYQNLYRTTDNGTTWKHLNTGVNGVPSVGFHGDTIIVGDNFYPAKLFRSTDQGATFKAISGITVLSGYVNAVLGTKFASIIAATSTGIFRSMDHGKVWTKVSNTPATFLRQRDDGSLFAFRSFSGSGVLRSTDSGSTWTEMKNGMGNTMVHSLAIASGGDLFCGSDAGLFRSTDAGENWVRIDTQKVKPYGIHVTVDRDGHLFFGGAKNGINSIVYRSTNGGVSWSEILPSIGLIDNQTTIRTLFASASGHLFAGTSGGMYRSAAVTTAVRDGKRTLGPSSFALEHNYPNPFNPSTRIRFTLGRPSEVRLTVHDMLGRTVAVLADGPHAAGGHSVDFMPHGLSSGTYLIRMTAGGTSLTRKMMFMK